jgi:hypothetical protein
VVNVVNVDTVDGSTDVSDSNIVMISVSTVVGVVEPTSVVV